MSTRTSGALVISPLVAGLLAMAGLFAAMPAYAALAPAPAPCATVGTPFLTLSRAITNNADSGVSGDWATDAYTEQVNVWVGTDGTTFCANASTTDGTFVTTGPLSPEHGASLPAGITGTFTGGENYVFTGLTSSDLNPAYSTTSVQSVTLPSESTATGGKFSWWVNDVFPSVASSTGSSYVQTYSLTYVTDRYGTWTDADASSGGDSGDITGTPSTVYVDASTGSDSNDGSSAHPLATLSAALSMVASGGTVYATGSYTGDLTISNPVTLMASSSAALTGMVTVNGASTTISGFDITNPTGDFGILVNHVAGVTVSNNTIHDIGTSVSGQNVYGVYFQSGGSSNLSGFTVSGNSITNIGTSTNAKSAGGIGIGDSTSHYNLSGASITGNTISNVVSNGKGAYGILLNLGSQGSLSADTASVSGATISGNTISNLTGGWEHAIGLETDTPSAAVTSNTISNLTSGTDVEAVHFEKNPSASTVSLTGTTYNSTSLSNSVSSVSVNASSAAYTIPSTTELNTYPEFLDNGTYRYAGLSVFSTIGSAITGVSTGGTVSVAAGTYAENVTINKKLTLAGAGSATGGTIISTTGNGITIAASGASASDRLTVKDLSVQGATNGVYIDSAVSYVTLDNVSLANNTAYGIEIHNSAVVSDLALTDVSATGNQIGLRVATTGSVNGLTVTNGSFDDNTQQGWYTAASSGSTSNQNNFTNISVTGTTFNGNTSKGIYLEKVDHATFSGITVDSDGTSGSFGSGFNINEKYGTYQSIALEDSTIANSGTGDVTNGTGVNIEARDDAPSYSANPATLSGVTLTGNTISGNQVGIRFGETGKNNAGPTGVVLRNNSISGNVSADYLNETAATDDAAQNWWGSASGPGTIAGVTTSPWYTTSGMTTLQYPVTTTGSEASTTVTTTTTLSGDSSQGGTVSVQADIPASTVVTGDASWDGTLSAPVASTTNLTFSGLTTTVGAAVTVGSSNSDLLFSQPVKLTFAGQAGKKAGWYDHAGTFTEISASCDSATSAKVGGVDLATTSPGASCKADSGSDLVVWTTHFSTFVTFVTAPVAPVISPAAGSYAGQVTISMDDSASGSAIRYTTDGSAPICNGNGNSYTNGQKITFITTTTVNAIRCQGTTASSQTSATYTITDATGGSGNSGSGSNGPVASSGGGGGGGSPSFGTPAGSTGGQVLGAEAFQFTANLTVGAKGQDVIELQNILIAEGDLAAGLNTGLFGPLTKAAVIKYQKAHGISPASGYVGPLTRTQLNKGSQATTPTTTGSVKQTLTDAQISAILGLLSSFGADQATITNVAHALGK